MHFGSKDACGDVPVDCLTTGRGYTPEAYLPHLNIMARFDFSLLRANVELTPFISSTPYVEIDEDSLVITDRTLQGYGKIDIDSMLLDTQFTYYGRFKYGSETELLRSVVTGVNIAGPGLVLLHSGDEPHV